MSEIYFYSPEDYKVSRRYYAILFLLFSIVFIGFIELLGYLNMTNSITFLQSTIITILGCGLPLFALNKFFTFLGQDLTFFNSEIIHFDGKEERRIDFKDIDAYKIKGVMLTVIPKSRNVKPLKFHLLVDRKQEVIDLFKINFKESKSLGTRY